MNLGLLLVLAALQPQWEPSTNTPGPIGTGGSLAGLSGSLYTLGGYGNDFLRFDGGSQSWTAGPAAPAFPVNGRLTSVGTDTIFTIADDYVGGGTAMLKYSAGPGSWETLAIVAPETWLYGPLVHGGGDHLYLAGEWGGQPRFERYTISTGVWTSMTPPPTSSVSTAALACPNGGDRIYLLLDNYYNSFQCYSKSANAWNAFDPPDCPAPVRDGASAWCPSSGATIHVLAGGTDYLVYDVAAQAWNPGPSLPEPVGLGAGLARTGNALYALAGGNQSSLWRLSLPDPPPAAPTALKQFRPDGTELLHGEGMRETSITIRATVSDPEGDEVRLAVSLRPVGEALTTTGSPGQPVASGSTASVTIAGLQTGVSYHWQAWTVDAQGQASPVLAFGLHPDVVTEADFQVLANAAPLAGTALLRRAEDGAMLPWGSKLFERTAVIVEALHDDPENDPARLEVEWRRADGLSGIVSGEPQAEGTPLAATLSLPPGSYRFRIRAVDSLGAAGAWSEAGSNPSDAADLLITAGGSAGKRFCGQSASGASALLLLALAAALARRP